MTRFFFHGQRGENESKEKRMGAKEERTEKKNS